MEEDEELAGPSTENPGGAGSEDAGPKSQRTYTPEELAKMNVKQLGRLKAQGVDTGDLISQINKRRKVESKARKAALKDGKVAAASSETSAVDQEEEEQAIS